ncbi:hypothetical protein TWF173_010651 [Orbilia oligospora]|nr:hypothetical protein TWF173_010651 [Orbilia oligospora]
MQPVVEFGLNPANPPAKLSRGRTRKRVVRMDDPGFPVANITSPRCFVQSSIADVKVVVGYSHLGLLNLCYQPFLDAAYKSLFDGLSAKADLKRANGRAEALRYMELSRPVAIIATDEGLTKSENGQVVEAVLQYVRNGGILILGLDFPSSIPMDEFDKFFQRKLGLPWASGDYHREDFEINAEGVFPPSGGSHGHFPQNYNMKGTSPTLAIVTAKQR